MFSKKYNVTISPTVLLTVRLASRIRHPVTRYTEGMKKNRMSCHMCEKAEPAFSHKQIVLLSKRNKKEERAYEKISI